MFALCTVAISFTVTQFGLTSASSPLLLLGGLLLALAVGVGFGTGLNVAVERLAFRPFRGRSAIAPLIATIGISFMLYQLALQLRYVTNIYIRGEHRSVPGIPEFPRMLLPDLLPDVNLLASLRLPFHAIYNLRELLVLLLAVGLTLLVHWYLSATRTGRALRACAQDSDMARLCGVNETGVIRLAFGLSGSLAGAAAFIYSLYYGGPYTLYGVQSGLIAFTAAVLGGIGNPRGALLSGLLLGMVAALSDFFLAAQWTPVLMMALLMLLLFLRPQGLANSEGSSGTEAPGAGTLVPGGLRSGRASTWLMGGLVVVLLLYPFLDVGLGWQQQTVMTGIVVLALLALGLNLVLGFAGLLDLGYAAFFAIGSYTTGLLLLPGSPLHTAIPGSNQFLVVLLLSAGVTALFGLVNGALTLRLRGEYLAITTLAFGQMIPRAALNLDGWTSGARGIAGLPPPQFLGYSLGSVVERYYLACGLLLLVAFAAMRLSSSRLGRAWSALNMDELAAVSCGIPALRTKVLAFVLGAAVAGGAGALFASTFSYVDPNQAEFQLSAMVLAMVVIGGAGSVPGAIVGALLVGGYDRLCIPLAGRWLENLGREQGWAWLVALDMRQFNFLTFGLILYLTVLVQARRRVEN
jgi:branched-chain amino acid transport system permease protein